ncbi:MAG: hypothetical protein H7Y13_05615 [Sphingobacteriaceae bacterium]|nr:hypothetical protein [Sphingobacteriaceae bacterium]
MRKFLFSLVFFAALGTSSVYADRNPERDRIIRRYDERNVYYDSRGEYHWQVIEREVWIPERRVRTVIGTRVIPGRYEVRAQRIKVYHNSGRYRNDNRYYDRDNSYNRGKKSHPHGMPPGQRKKQDNRYDDRDYDYRDREYENRGRSLPEQVLEEIGRRRL